MGQVAASLRPRDSARSARRSASRLIRRVTEIRDSALQLTGYVPGQAVATAVQDLLAAMAGLDGQHRLWTPPPRPAGCAWPSAPPPAPAAPPARADRHALLRRAPASPRKPRGCARSPPPTPPRRPIRRGPARTRRPARFRDSAGPPVAAERAGSIMTAAVSARILSPRRVTNWLEPRALDRRRRDRGRLARRRHHLTGAGPEQPWPSSPRPSCPPSCHQARHARHTVGDRYLGNRHQRIPVLAFIVVPRRRGRLALLAAAPGHPAP